mgnify:CR=1 FL=1|jgi:hypothetical protein
MEKKIKVRYLLYALEVTQILVYDSVRVLTKPSSMEAICSLEERFRESAELEQLLDRGRVRAGRQFRHREWM